MVASWASASRGCQNVAHRAFATTIAPLSSRAENVGILAVEAYVASRCVRQEDLEKADGVSTGKYTVGLGQKKLAFVDDREDINSIMLTAVQRLLDNYGIDPKQIGRLEVGTESFVDKSKSTKTTLMRLFEDAGNRDLEGATVVNACYGGTAALFNSAAWVESSEWDGRYALFVAGDVAVYEPGPARPTGGVGAVAVLVGPNAPLRLVPKTRASHAVDVYDFYKPNMSSEYPMVDGGLSQACYFRAVDDCYTKSMDKLASTGYNGGRAAPHGMHTVDTAFDNFIFHSPYNKLVQQSFRRLFFNDVRRFKQAGLTLPPLLQAIAPLADMPYNQTLTSKDVDKALQAIPSEYYEKIVGPGAWFSQNIGNSYTGAVYGNITALVSKLGAALTGKRVGVFSYGSGAIASMFALEGVDTSSSGKSAGAALATGSPSVPALDASPFTLANMRKVVDLETRLDTRQDVDPSEFTEAMLMRERFYGRAGGIPAGSLSNVPVGAWYLKEVKENHVRIYDRRV